MKEKEPKSRRRFLADLLFLSGGLAAASLISNTMLPRNDQPRLPDQVLRTESLNAPKYRPGGSDEGVVSESRCLSEEEIAALSSPAVDEAGYRYQLEHKNYAYGGYQLPRQD